MKVKSCTKCGLAFSGHGLRKFCSVECNAQWRKTYKEAWRGSHTQQERERLREYERRRTRFRTPESREVRRDYMRRRYQEMVAAYEVVREFGFSNRTGDQNETGKPA